MKCICDININSYEIISDGDWITIYMCNDSDGYYLEAIGDGNAVVEIKYCPICGRKLMED